MIGVQWAKSIGTQWNMVCDEKIAIAEFSSTRSGAIWDGFIGYDVGQEMSIMAWDDDSRKLWLVVKMCNDQR